LLVYGKYLYYTPFLDLKVVTNNLRMILARLAFYLCREQPKPRPSSHRKQSPYSYCGTWSCDSHLPQNLSSPGFMYPSQGGIDMGQTVMQARQSRQVSGLTPKAYSTRRSFPRPTNPMACARYSSVQVRTHRPHSTQSLFRKG
jgi:hypothetical protein